MSGFRFIYGGNATAGCVVRPKSKKQSVYALNRFPVGHTKSITVEGTFIEATPAANKALIDQIEEFTRNPGLVAGVEWWDGASWVPTSYYLPINAYLLSGPTVVDCMLPAGPLEHIVEANWSLTIEAVYLNDQMARSVVELTESISYQGNGGAVWELAPQALAVDVYQKTSEYSKMMIQQSGRVVTKGAAAVTIPSPVIATAQAQINPEFRLNDKYKQEGTGIILHEVDYAYSFQVPTPPGVLVPAYLT